MSGPTSFRFSQRAARTTEAPISYLMAQAVSNPKLISLAAGLVDYDTLPASETAALLGKILADPAMAPKALQYGTTQGLADLRRMLLEHMAKLDGVATDELGASPDDVLITTGSQQLLFTITDTLVDAGDIVITEWPSYFVYTGMLRSMGAEVRCVEMDEGGMIPAQLETLLASIARQGGLSRVKIVYTCDYHQNPTGITLAQERKPQILEIVQRFSADHRILLMEDAAYRELNYPLDTAGKTRPAVAASQRTIKSYDTENQHVALLQTFSKPFAPGLKTGYGLLPRDLVEPVALQKGAQDFGSNNLSQHLLLAAMREGVYTQHVGVLCRQYALKRDAMLAALKQHLGDFEPGATRWTKPTGGLYVWLTLPERFDTGREGALFGRSLAEGVIYVPGIYCYPQDAARTVPRNSMRLSFGVASVEQIHEGIARLAKAIKTT